jgi:plasmid stabilization system protein ParE
MTSLNGDAPRYSVSSSDEAEADIDKAYLFVQRSNGPEFTAQWLAELRAAIRSIPEPLGPRAHAIDEEVSRRYGVEVRRKLYYGPGARRNRTPYRILFFIVAPLEAGDETVIRVLRILHGSQALDPETDEGPAPQ